MNKTQYQIRYFILLICFLGGINLNVFAYGYYKESLYGIMTTDGKIITPAIYDDIDTRAVDTRFVQDTLHLVAIKDGKRGVIGTDGKQLGKIKYDYVSIYDRPLYELKLNGKPGFLNKQGKECIPFVYDSYITTYESKGWYLFRKGDKYGMVDSNNNIIFPFEYDDIEYHSEKNYRNAGNIALQKNNKWALANNKGEIITPFMYKKIELFEDGGAVAQGDTCYYFLSSAGKLISTLAHKEAIEDLQPLVCITSSTGGNYSRLKEFSLYNYNGEKLSSYKGSEIYSFSSEGIASIRVSDGYVLIDTLGQFISHVDVGVPKGREFYGLTFWGGYAVAQDASGKHGVIDRIGKTIIPFKYTDLERLISYDSDKQLFVTRNNNWDAEGIIAIDKGLITPLKYRRLYFYDGKFIKGSTQNEDGSKGEGVISVDGKELTPFIYDEVSSAGDSIDVAVLKLDKKIGFFNVKTGAETGLVFDDWSYSRSYFGNCITVKKGNYKGVINSDCEFVLDCIYSDIEYTTNGCIIATNKEGKSAIFDIKGKMLRSFGKERLYYFHNNLLVFSVSNDN